MFNITDDQIKHTKIALIKNLENPQHNTNMPAPQLECTCPLTDHDTSHP